MYIYRAVARTRTPQFDKQVKDLMGGLSSKLLNREKIPIGLLGLKPDQKMMTPLNFVTSDQD